MIHPWQQLQWQKIQQQRVANRLPHALLLSGPEGLAKLDFAHQLAKGLLCKNISSEGYACDECVACNLIAAQTHPDLFVIQAEERGKVIKVDNVRQLSSDLNLTSQLNGYKVALIVDAHDMNINAANSLLKTLEEPTRDAILILISSNPQKLPVTVRSRCQSIHFTLPDEQLAHQWLQTKGIEQPQHLLNLAHGAPLLALELAQSDLLSFHQLLVSNLLSVSKNQSIVEAASALHKLPLSYLLNWLYDWTEDLIKLHQCGDTSALVHEADKKELLALKMRSSVKGLYDYLDQINKIKQLQLISLNSQLLWEDLLLSWHKQLKRA